MDKNKIQKVLRVNWNKKENCFGFSYPCRQGKFLGYEVAVFMQELIKKGLYSDFDLKSFKCTVELTEEKYEQLVKEPPLRD